jgi:hypothetical protein
MQKAHMPPDLLFPLPYATFSSLSICHPTLYSIILRSSCHSTPTPAALSWQNFGIPPPHEHAPLMIASGSALRNCLLLLLFLLLFLTHRKRERKKEKERERKREEKEREREREGRDKERDKETKREIEREREDIWRAKTCIGHRHT